MTAAKLLRVVSADLLRRDIYPAVNIRIFSASRTFCVLVCRPYMVSSLQSILNNPVPNPAFAPSFATTA